MTQVHFTLKSEEIQSIIEYILFVDFPLVD